MNNTESSYDLWVDSRTEKDDGGCTCFNNAPCAHCLSTCVECGGHFEYDYPFCFDCGWFPALEGETIMNNDIEKYKNIAAVLNENIVTVMVSFDKDYRHPGSDQVSKTYLYKCPKDIAENLKIGDLVIVDAKDEMHKVTITEIHESVQISPDSATRYKWVISALDTKPWEDQVALETLNAQRLLQEHSSATRKRFLEASGLSQVQLLQELPAIPTDES